MITLLFASLNSFSAYKFKIISLLDFWLPWCWTFRYNCCVLALVHVLDFPINLILWESLITAIPRFFFLASLGTMYTGISKVKLWSSRYFVVIYNFVKQTTAVFSRIILIFILGTRFRLTKRMLSNLITVYILKLCYSIHKPNLNFIG